MPSIVWKIKESSTRNKFIRFKKFEHAARHYDGTNPPIKYVDGIPEPLELSKLRASKKIKKKSNKNISEKLRKVDVNSAGVCVRIYSSKEISIKDINKSLKKCYPSLSINVEEIRTTDEKKIGGEVNRIKSSIDLIGMSINRVLSELYK